MIINDKRALAYIQLIKSGEPSVPTIQPIAGADNIELVHVLGWTLIAKKGEFKEGDKCVYFEIDSRLPAEERYEFLASKHYHVKTYKLNKFGVVSQGLALPLSEFPEIDPETPVNTDVTDLLKVTYAVKEDNVRKSDPRVCRFNDFKKKHSKFFQNKLVKRLMRHKWFRELMLNLFGGKKIKKDAWPTQFVSKTDEERIQNCPELLQIKAPFVVTEKLDGTSTTILVERLKFGKFKTYICSRNVCYGDGSLNKDRVYMSNDNIYVEMAEKYCIPDFLKEYLAHNPKLKWACVQGESYGKDWQGNPLKQTDHKFAAFNFIDSEHGRYGSIEGRAILEKALIPWVPIVNEAFILPDTVAEMLAYATGPSSVNPDVLREGYVLRSLDGKTSFKAVSPEYLLAKGE